MTGAGDRSLDIVMVEPWLGGSHLQWIDGYRRSSRHRVDVVGLPADRWRWRLRGGPAAASELVRNRLRHGPRPDLLVVSSPLDTARMLGLLRSELDGVPVVAYQHESQLLYPRSGNPDDDALHDWFSWLAVDAVLFNSEWHRRSVAAALPAFVGRFPDDDHEPLLDGILAKFETLPLGVDLSWTEPLAGRAEPRPERGSAPVILWPHRWEADKDPAAFGRAIDRLERDGLDFRLVLAGTASPFGDPLRDELARRHAARVVACGPFTTDDYRSWVARSDIVVSCARHDFFGVGVAEAVAAGCVPVVPDALHYPELLGPAGRPFLYRPGTFGSRLAEVVANLDDWRDRAQPLRGAVRRFDWAAMAAVYDDRFARAAAGRPVDRR